VKHIIILTIPAIAYLTTNAASFRGLSDLPGGSFLSVAMGVSSNGQVVVGYSSSANGTEAVRWTPTNGLVGLGDLPGGTFSSFANAISPEGAVIVGVGRSAAGGEAFRWTQSAGMIGLGDLPGGAFNSAAYGASADGHVIVGIGVSTLSGTRPEAFRWTPTNGMVALGDLPGGDYSSQAWAVSADGTVIVGSSSSSNGTASEAFRWTEATGMVALGDFPNGNFSSIAYGISADGSVIVGRGYSGAFDANTHEAFSWTSDTGLIRLGFISCSDWSIAHAASGDGSVIVGDPESNRGDCAFIWDGQRGMRNLHEVLTNQYGLQLTGWQLSGARGISGDGTVIVGFGTNPNGQTEGWIADLNRSRLEIDRVDDKILLSWATNGPNFLLEHTPSLTPVMWNTNSATVFRIGDKFVVTNTVTAPQLFFRLRGP